MITTLGRLVMTRSVDELVKSEKISQADLGGIINKHTRMQYGEVSESDAVQNTQAALTQDGRTLGAHTVNGIKLWIITDYADEHTVTTILLPEDY